MDKHHDAPSRRGTRRRKLNKVAVAVLVRRIELPRRAPVSRVSLPGWASRSLRRWARARLLPRSPSPPPLSPHPSCQALLGLTIAWKLRSDDAGEPGQLELRKMAHEGGPRYRAYLESHPNARVDLTEREPRRRRRAGWFASLTHLGGARGASVSSVSAAAADSDPATNAPPPSMDLVTAAGAGIAPPRRTPTSPTLPTRPSTRLPPRRRRGPPPTERRRRSRSR